jgi:AraC-like DNA-binding protein
MFTLLQGEPRQDEMKNVYVERSIQYMVEHIQSSLTLDEMAHHIGLSKPHFVHLFKQVTRYSPIDYFLRLKIQRSCQYLDLTDYHIKEISKSIGIQDPYYFSRVFRKVMGQSPSEYRKTKRG